MRKTAFRVFVALLLGAAVLGWSPLTAGAGDGRPDGAKPGKAVAEAPDAGGAGAIAGNPAWDGDGPAPRVLHAGNVTTDGSHCIGNDCNTDPPAPTYGFDTLRLMENNLRILAMDTSGGAFPTRDWQVEFNSTSNGGASYYMIHDCGNTASTTSTCGGTSQFTIEAGADNDSIYVDSSGNQGGNVGFGTTSPAVDLDVLSGNTPTLRLGQDNSSGFGPQVWDVAGNEANFFIRDVTNGSALPIRIQPGTASNTLFLANTERVGINTNAPAADLHIKNTTGRSRLRFQDTTAATPSNWEMGTANNGRFTISEQGNATNQFTIDASGNAVFEGTVTANGVVLTDFRLGLDELRTANVALSSRLAAAEAQNKALLDRLAALEAAFANLGG